MARTMAKLKPQARRAGGKKRLAKSRVPAVGKPGVKSPSLTLPRLRGREGRGPQQRFQATHFREEDFRADGLRTYARYRDLGMCKATNGLLQAHVIRLVPPCDPAVVSKRHYHDVDLQMIYVLNGWIKGEYDGQVVTMRKGGAWLQPPRIKHTVLDYSDDCELLEIIVPAEFETVELEAGE
jgi:Cupin domain